jgi:hypothetical protein
MSSVKHIRIFCSLFCFFRRSLPLGSALALFRCFTVGTGSGQVFEKMQNFGVFSEILRFRNCGQVRASVHILKRGGGWLKGVPVLQSATPPDSAILSSGVGSERIRFAARDVFDAPWRSGHLDRQAPIGESYLSPRGWITH